MIMVVYSGCVCFDCEGMLLMIFGYFGMFLLKKFGIIKFVMCVYV